MPENLYFVGFQGEELYIKVARVLKTTKLFYYISLREARETLVGDPLAHHSFQERYEKDDEGRKFFLSAKEAVEDARKNQEALADMKEREIVRHRQRVANATAYLEQEKTDES